MYWLPCISTRCYGIIAPYTMVQMHVHNYIRDGKTRDRSYKYDITYKYTWMTTEIIEFNLPGNAWWHACSIVMSTTVPVGYDTGVWCSTSSQCGSFDDMNTWRRWRYDAMMLDFCGKSWNSITIAHTCSMAIHNNVLYLTWLFFILFYYVCVYILLIIYKYYVVIITLRWWSIKRERLFRKICLSLAV